MKRYIICLLALIICSSSLKTAQASIPEEAESADNPNNPLIDYKFEVPSGLKPQVDFWKKVFSQYDTYQILVHDNKYLSVIYEVVDLSYLKEKKLSYKQELKYRRARVNEVKKKYMRILNRLAADPEVAQERLEPEERRVYDMFYGIKDPDKFAQAAKEKRLRAQVGQRGRFMKGVYNWGKYRDRIEEIFIQQGLPARLTYLPFVESFFTLEAVSCVKAVGIWQFMSYTGRLYLKINRVADERRDPYKATLAAAKLLRSNYDMLGSWPLAITAYNHGPHGVARAVKKTGSNDLTDLIENYNQKRFGFASQNFYAEFLAVVDIVSNYKSYFGDIELAEPLKFDIFALPGSMTVGALTKYCDLSLDTIKRLNPELTKASLTSKLRLPVGYELQIPVGTKDAVAAQYAQIQSGSKTAVAEAREPEPEIAGDGWYRVRRGDTLGEIARRCNTTTAALMELNGISDARRINLGQRLRLVSSKSEEQVAVSSEPKPAAGKPVSGGDTHRVGKGETLWSIARRYNVSVEALKELNDLQGGHLKAGQRLQLPNTAVVVAQAEVDAKEEKSSERAEQADEERKSQASDKPVVLSQPKPDVVAVTARQKSSPQPDLLNNDNLRLSANANNNMIKITVAPLETIGHYADWCEVSTSSIRRLNGWGRPRPLSVGQTIKLDLSKVGHEMFEAKRLAYHQQLQKDYLNNYKIERVQTHVLEPQQNIWYLCQMVYKVPLWLVEKYNQGRDLTQLNPGDQLNIPIVAQKM